MNMDVLIVPLIVFMVIVAPLWLILHYRSKKQVGKGFSDEEYQQLNELASRAEKMAERIETLEAILDANSPQWRTKHEN
ncbi:envelope stress response membrane protein PspB [Paraferrimonas sp. SM1919]|uniref:envelope stress response membrane protein PspB n=1 Tax=Paraferrimonas sp. SM1919 TaxID=2662263 RepID=UPI0013D55D05|nr:envelope stress response membrane protein PspB [Paraferrimonas sp. SM1919]